MSIYIYICEYIYIYIYIYMMFSLLPRECIILGTNNGKSKIPHVTRPLTITINRTFFLF